MSCDPVTSTGPLPSARMDFIRILATDVDRLVQWQQRWPRFSHQVWAQPSLSGTKVTEFVHSYHHRTPGTRVGIPTRGTANKCPTN
eukprot:803338-Rhodomonas_salina.2